MVTSGAPGRRKGFSPAEGDPARRDLSASPSRRSACLGALLLFGACAGEPGSAEPPPAPAGVPWFVDIAAESGLDFAHVHGASGKWYLPETMGGGAALFDADGDGDLDVYFTNGNGDPGSGVPGPTPPRNRFYLQDSPGHFVDATERSGLGDPGYGMGVAVLDIDNDGDLDLYSGTDLREPSLDLPFALTHNDVATFLGHHHGRHETMLPG